jgi:hypothetical protein
VIISENRYPSRRKSGTGFFGVMRVEGVMAYRLSRLPSRFPVGTKFVIEGRRGGEGQVQVYSRYIEFPDGTFFPLPTSPVQRKSGASRRSGKSKSHSRRH